MKMKHVYPGALTLAVVFVGVAALSSSSGKAYLQSQAAAQTAADESAQTVSNSQPAPYGWKMNSDDSENAGESDDDSEDSAAPVTTPAPKSTPQPAPTPKPTTTTKAPGTYTLADIAKHATAASCWTAISGNVYDLTPFIPNHPGGDQILAVCGIDGTQAFLNQHGGQGRPQSELASLKIGTLAQ